MEVTAASVQDRNGALLVLSQLEPFGERLKVLFADSAYSGFLQDCASYMHAWTLEIVTKPADQKGFVVQPKRWIVERTIAWSVKYWRLVKDYEYRVETSKAMICWAIVSHMLHKSTRESAVA